jgi:hypothetical protein
MEFHDRRRGPVSDVLDGIYGNGKRYRISDIQGNSEGHVTPGPEGTVQVARSTRSKATKSLSPDAILGIEEARAARDGSRSVLYSRPEHQQHGYGRV